MPQCAHAVWIELDLILPQRSAEPFDAGHAGHGEDAIAQIEFREIAQHHRIGVAFDDDTRRLR